MAAHNHLEDTWGIAATHAEHHVGDYIRYNVGGDARCGSIVWICAPGGQEGQPRSVRYVVQPEDREGQDLILPGNILIRAMPRPEQQNSAAQAAELEQAVLEMCATLSIPIIVHTEIDDSGQPFYVWHIGESTPQQPWGLHVGMHRHLIGALQGALEKLIEHAQQQGPASQA